MAWLPASGVVVLIDWFKKLFLQRFPKLLYYSYGLVVGVHYRLLPILFQRTYLNH